MEFRHFVTFDAISRMGTLLAAARSLGCSQSTVTLHVQQLERELGVPLFERRGKKVIMTEAGRRLQKRGREMLDSLTDLTQDMRSLRTGAAGLVRLGAVEPVANVQMPPLLTRLCEVMPGLEVRLDVAGSDTIAARVEAGDLDFGIAASPGERCAVRFEPLFAEELVAAFPAGNEAARRSRVRSRDLIRERILLTARSCAYRRSILNAFERAGCPIRMTHEIGSIQALLSSVRAGLGVGILPRAAVPQPARGMVIRTLSDVKLATPIGLVVRAGVGSPSLASERVRDYLCHRLRRTL